MSIFEYVVALLMDQVESMSICINQVKFKELSSFGYLFKYYKI